jgi:GGDEF domain-containing protein
MSIDAPQTEPLVTLPAAPARDPHAFIGLLARELDAALPGISVHFHDPEHGIEFDLDHGGRHQLSYRLRHKGASLGEITLRFRNRFSGGEIDRIESILARALPALVSLIDELRTSGSSDIDPDTALQTRAALLRHLARAKGTVDGPTTLLIVRIDEAADAGIRRRVALQLAAVLGDPDRAYRIDDRAFAVTLYRGDAAAERFLAERVRLMVAAMPIALPAPTVTVALSKLPLGEDPQITLLRAERDLAQRADVRNRVITLS